MSARIWEGGNEGYWGKRTSTLDWCEENYVIWQYIAEFWNSISNLAFIVLPLLGAYFDTTRNSYRFTVARLSVIVVGLGSFAFHATLKWATQLLDEIPMMYCICTLLYCAFENPIGQKKKYGWKLPALLLFIPTVVTVTYVFVEVPVFHHGTYGTLVGLLCLKCAQLARARPEHSKYLMKSVSCLAGAFFVWNLDNLICPDIRAIRAQILSLSSSPLFPNQMAPLFNSFVYALSTLFQFHMFWHIAMGFSTTYMLVFLQLNQDPRAKYAVVYKFGVPVVVDAKSVKKKKA